MSADMLNAVTLIRFPPVENETRFDKRLRGDVLVSEDDLWCGGAQQTVGFIGGLRRRTHEGSLMESEGMSNPNEGLTEEIKRAAVCVHMKEAVGVPP